MITHRILMLVTAAVLAVGSCLLAPGSSAAQIPFFSENFDGLPLGPNVDEGLAGENVWTKTAPEGWTIDDSGIPGVGTDQDGVTEWAGWSFTDKDWWTTTAGDQNRSQFTNASGAVAVADPDEWDDLPHADAAAAGWYDTFLSTPAISLAGIDGGTAELTFDSSWRPEFDGNFHQTANITVAYDGGAAVEIALWESDSGSANYKTDATNETVTFPLNNPAGAESMVIAFGLFDAGNDWWWAIDNIEVTGMISATALTSVANGSWNAAGTWDGGAAIPTDGLPVIIGGHEINVDSPGTALTLTVEGGGVSIGADQTLSVGYPADFDEGATLTLGAGATFSAGGPVSFAGGNTVTLGDNAVLNSGDLLDIGADSTVTLGPGAALSAAAGGSIQTLTTAGDATIDTGGNMSLGSLDATAAGTFTKVGRGLLTLDSVAAADTVFDVQGGTLLARGADLLGGATRVTLDGGTLELQGQAVSTENALTELFYNLPLGESSVLAPIDSGNGLLTRVADNMLVLDAALDYPDTNSIPERGEIQVEDFGAAWHGQITVGGANLPAGPVSFGTASDDGSMLYIDVNGNGTFSDPGDLIVDNNGDHGRQERTGTIDLSAGTYDFVAGMYERGGDDNMTVVFAPGANLTWQQMSVVDPTAAAQQGIWAGLAYDAIDVAGLDVTVASDSALQVRAAGVTAFGGLALQQGILTTSGAADGIGFAATTVPADATGTLGVNAEIATALGPLDANGATATFFKTGPEAVTLDGAGAAGLDNLTFDVQEGSLIGLHSVNPFGGGELLLSGGEVVLAASPSSSVPVVYDNQVTVNADSTLTAGAAAGGTRDRDVTLGSAANGVALQSGTLTVQTTDDYRLDVAGPVSGPGTLEVIQGDVTFSGGGDVATAKLSGGSLSLAADLQVQNLTVTGGVLDTGGSQLVVSNRMILGNTPFMIDDGSTLVVSSSDLGNGAVDRLITLGGGTLEAGSSPIPVDGLVSFWTLDDGPGSMIATDSVGENHGELMDVDSQDGWVAGHTGNADDYAVRFEGIAGQHIAVGADPSLQPLDEVTVSAWVNVDQFITWAGVAGWAHDSGATESGYYLGTHNGLHFAVATQDTGGLSYLSTDLGQIGQWHHLVGTYDGATQRLYLDGVEVATAEAPGGPIDWEPLGDEDGFEIGRFHDDNEDIPVAAAVDDVIVYSRAISPDEIDILYHLEPGAEALELPRTNLLVTADSSLALSSAGDAVLGNLTLDGGVTLTVENVAVSFNDVTAGDGAVVEADALVVRGTLSPADGPGTLEIRGELELEDEAVLRVELAGADNDLVLVETDAFVGGTLDVQATAVLGDVGEHTRRIMAILGDEAEIVASFNVEPAEGQHVGSGVFHQAVIYDPGGTYIDLSVFQAAAGDANGDKQVNNADLQEILGAGSFGNPGDWGWGQGDFNGDRAVNNSDLQLILATGLFGTGSYAATPAAGLTAVPEPHAWALLASGVLALLAMRRRRRRA